MPSSIAQSCASLLLLAIAGSLHAQRFTPDAAMQGSCATATSNATMAAKHEPGTRLRVRGRVWQPDGKTPAAGVIVYAYHTDQSGVYNRAPGQPPHFRAWVKTDANGAFTLDTVMPGVYPNRSAAAHVHFQAWSTRVQPQHGPTLLFEGDPLISPREKSESQSLGRFGFIRPFTTAKDGSREVTIEWKLKEQGESFEPVIFHGLSGCGGKMPQ